MRFPGLVSIALVLSTTMASAPPAVAGCQLLRFKENEEDGGDED